MISALHNKQANRQTDNRQADKHHYRVKPPYLRAGKWWQLSSLNFQNKHKIKFFILIKSLRFVTQIRLYLALGCFHVDVYFTADEPGLCSGFSNNYTQASCIAYTRRYYIGSERPKLTHFRTIQCRQRTYRRFSVIAWQRVGCQAVRSGLLPVVVIRSRTCHGRWTRRCRITYRQAWAQRSMQVLRFLSGQKMGFSPRRGIILPR